MSEKIYTFHVSFPASVRAGSHYRFKFYFGSEKSTENQIASDRKWKLIWVYEVAFQRGYTGEIFAANIFSVTKHHAAEQGTLHYDCTSVASCYSASANPVAGFCFTDRKMVKWVQQITCSFSLASTKSSAATTTTGAICMVTTTTTIAPSQSIFGICQPFSWCHIWRSAHELFVPKLFEHPCSPDNRNCLPKVGLAAFFLPHSTSRKIFSLAVHFWKLKRRRESQ